jgi:hypothetical protein
VNHSPSIRPIYGNRRETSVRDVRSHEQAQETATPDAGHGPNRHLDGCIDAAERSARRVSIDPVEQVINAWSRRKEYAQVVMGCSVRGCLRPGAAQPAAGFLRQGARLWSARAISDRGVTVGVGGGYGAQENRKGQVEPERAVIGAPDGRPAVVVGTGGVIVLARACARVGARNRVSCSMLLRGAQRPVVVVGVGVSSGRSLLGEGFT